MEQAIVEAPIESRPSKQLRPFLPCARKRGATGGQGIAGFETRSERRTVRRLAAILLLSLLTLTPAQSQDGEALPSPKVDAKDGALQAARRLSEESLQAARKARDPEAIARARREWRKALRVAILEQRKLLASRPGLAAENRHSALRLELFESLLVEPFDGPALAELGEALESEPANRCAALRLRLSYASPEGRRGIIQKILEAGPLLALSGGGTIDLNPSKIGASLTLLAVIDPLYAPARPRVLALSTKIQKAGGQSLILGLGPRQSSEPSTKSDTTKNNDSEAHPDEKTLACPESGPDPRDQLAMIRPFLMIVLFEGKVVLVDPYPAELEDWLEGRAK